MTTSFPRFLGDKNGAFILDNLEKISNKVDQITVVAPDDYATKRLPLPKNVIIYRFTYFFPRTLQRIAYNFGLESNLRKSLLARLQLFLFFPIFLITALQRSKDADVIHAHWTAAGLVGAVVRKLTGKKLIVTVHGTDLAIVKGGLIKYLTKFVFNNADSIIVVSESMVKDLEKHFDIGKKAVVIPNGVVLSLYKGIKNQDGQKLQNLIFIGRLHRSKNIPVLLKAMKELESKLPKLKLTIVGSGSEEGYLRSLAGKMGLRDRVVFAGEVERSKIPQLLSKSSVLVLPSEREGFGMALIEAMAAGLPVIGSDTGGISNIIKEGHTGFKFPVGDFGKLATLIYTLLKDKGLYRKISANAEKEAYDNYSIYKVAKKHIELYKSLI